MDCRRTLKEARNKKGGEIFETFSLGGPSEFLVVSRTRWDEHQSEAECAEEGIEKCAASVAEKLRLLQRLEDSGKRAGKSSVLLGVRRKER